jgi:molybdopterin molybdotransferase
MTELFTVHTPPAAWARFVEHFQPQVRTARSPPPTRWIACWRSNWSRRKICRNLHAPPSMATPSPRPTPTAPRPVCPPFSTSPAKCRWARLPPLRLGLGAAALVHTGGMIPPGADAVVMIEETQRVAAGHIEVFRPVAEGQNVVQVGEDIRRGQAILTPGHRLRPQDIGGLLALGITEVIVATPPVVGIISTGDEVVPPDRQCSRGRCATSTPTRWQGWPCAPAPAPSATASCPTTARRWKPPPRAPWQECDIVVFSAGSSVSYRDMTADVIDGLGKPGVLVHGVSVKPGKPTILAVCDGKAVFGLPGNPVSAMVIFDLFITPAIALLLGAQKPPQSTVKARLARNLASESGREDYVQVRLEEREGEVWAVPVLGKSNLIYTLVNAEGTVKIPLDANGLRAGEWVTVVMQ